MRSSTVVVLTVLWSIVLLPGVIRDRRSSPASTVDTFANAMGRLASSDVRRVMVPGGGPRMLVYPRVAKRDAMLERRRSLLLRLTGSVGAGFLLALLFGGWAWTLPALAAVALGVYIAALRSLVVHAQRARAVVPLHPVRAAARGAAPAHASTGDATEHEPAADGVAAEPLFG